MSCSSTQHHAGFNTPPTTCSSVLGPVFQGDRIDPANTERAKLLIVDDREENLLAFEKQLQGHDLQLITARSGDEALNLLLAHEFAVALIDVQMPRMDGFQLAELMRCSERTRHIPIIFVTAGLHDRSKVFKGYDTGAVDFLIKPIESHVLNSKISVFLQLFRQKRLLTQQVAELTHTKEQLTRDIAERKRAEDALRQSEARFRSVLEASRDLIYRLNLVSGRYEYVSPSVTSVLGRSPAEVMGMRIDEAWQLIHPDDLSAMQTAMQALMSEGHAEVEYRHRLESGEYRWMSNDMSLVRDDYGVPLYRDGIIRDVTERKLAEAERLARADERKNELLAVLSHEMRNPLAPLKNGLHVLENAPPGSEPAKRAIAIMNRQVDQLACLVEDLLDVTRIARNKIQLECHSVDLTELLQRATEDHRFIFEKLGVQLNCVAQANVVRVKGDMSRLTRAVGNLLNNAAKFTPRGGRVTLQLDTDGSKRALVSVMDTGLGMTPETLGRLFEPFMQAEATLHRSKAGLGLGLALVKGIAEVHGGSVHVESAGLGLGSKFTIVLPIANNEPP